MITIQGIEKKMADIKSKMETVKADLITDLELFEKFGVSNLSETERTQMQERLEELEKEMESMADFRAKVGKSLERIAKIDKLRKSNSNEQPPAKD